MNRSIRSIQNGMTFVAILGGLVWNLCQPPTCLHAASATVHYTYDERGRLIKADYGAAGSFTYLYDQAGNLLRAESTAGAHPAGEDSGAPSSEVQKTAPQSR